MDPGIVCYQHCHERKIFCFKLPENCQLCNYDLTQTSILPFSIPYPFIRASQYTCAVVIKPTIGDFLNDYYNSIDLHIGVTTSTGAIVEFDENGLRRHFSNEWNQCLLLDQIPLSWYEHWDNVLTKVCKQKCWTPQHYNETTQNCYTFVLKFLKNLNYENLSKAACNKNDFCEKYIIPRTISAGKYISLYRRIKQNDFYVD